MEKTIIYSEADKIGTITINRPDALNALNGQVIEELEEIITIIEKDQDIRALVITGAGRSFVAGADIGEQSVLDLDGGRKWGQKGSALFRRIEKLEIPTVAAVNGFALGGGCELAMSCDMIFASEKAKFGQPEVGLGITPGFSGTQRLPRWVGVSKAKELILSGKIIKAVEAKEIGLVNQIFEAEKLLEEVVAFLKTVVSNAPIAVKYSKAAIDRGYEMDIDSGIAVENELFAMCFASEDQNEGMNAFLEKRKAEFMNK